MIRTLGTTRIRITVRRDGGGPDATSADLVYFAPLSGSVSGGTFDGAVVLESGGRLTNVRFHAP